MGKKSIKRLSEKLEVSSDDLTPSDLSVAAELDQYQGLLKALMLQKNHQDVMTGPADWLHWQRTGWREEERDKYLGEVSLFMQHLNTCALFLKCISILQMSQLLLLALKMQKDSG